MAVLRVRYTSGETDEWEVAERISADDVARTFISAFKRGQVVGVPVKATHSDLAADFGAVGIRLTEVASWHLDGLLDEQGLLGLWAEAEGLANGEHDDDH